jgi:hypothetical protein
MFYCCFLSLFSLSLSLSFSPVNSNTAQSDGGLELEAVKILDVWIRGAG